MAGALTELASADQTANAGYTGTQGASVGPNRVWVTGGFDDTVAFTEVDRSDLSFNQYVETTVSDISTASTLPSGVDNIAQTSHYYDGSIYVFAREPEVFEIDASDLSYTGNSWHQIVPDTEYSDAIFEGIERYDGAAFSNPKWFVSCRQSDRGIFRLDSSFNYEKTYRPINDYPQLDDGSPGYDGISVFDHDGTTYLCGAVTRGWERSPGIEVFEYDAGDDRWRYKWSATVGGDELHTPDEGFQVVSPSEVYAGIRFPHTTDTSDSRKVYVSKQDWTDAL